MYSFNKTRHDANWREFRHAYFRRGHPELLPFIKRKTNNSAALLTPMEVAADLLGDEDSQGCHDADHHDAAWDAAAAVAGAAAFRAPSGVDGDAGGGGATAGSAEPAQRDAWAHRDAATLLGQLADTALGLESAGGDWQQRDGGRPELAVETSGPRLPSRRSAGGYADQHPPR